jgi:PPP family 3-phenylpropionic acid transporter
VFYAALFVALGVQLPFLPVWLAAKGLDAGVIGLVLAIPMMVRVFAIPLATRQADRRDALRAAITLAAAAAVLGYGAVGLAQGTIAITAALALAALCHTPIIPLTDAYALRGLGRRGRAYGPVRLWGSVAFIVGSLGAGVLLDVLAARQLIWLVVAAMVLVAAAALALAPLGERGVIAPATASSRNALLRDPAFLMVVMAASLIQASHAVFYGFSAIAWQRAGLDGGAIGALWALGVVAEIALFALSARLPFGPIGLLLLGAAGAFIRWCAMAFDPPTALLPLVQCLHALSFGATYLGALGFIARAAPTQFGATAQGHLAVASGLAMAATTGVSGLLYARWGELAYAAMAITAAAGGGIAFIVHRWTRGAES